MKIATFNINNINRRLPNLLPPVALNPAIKVVDPGTLGFLDWLKASKPDAVCLQELKCSERDFPAARSRRLAIRQFGAEKRPGTALRSWRDANPF